MIQLAPPDDVAFRLLKLEQQLKAYEALHSGELADLWQNLNDCKRALTEVLLSKDNSCPKEANPLATELRHPRD